MVGFFGDFQYPFPTLQVTPIIKLNFNRNSNYNQSRKNPKSKFHGNLFENMVLLEVKEFHGLHDDLKLYQKVNPWPPSCTEVVQPKNR